MNIQWRESENEGHDKRTELSILKAPNLVPQSCEAYEEGRGECVHVLQRLCIMC